MSYIYWTKIAYLQVTNLVSETYILDQNSYFDPVIDIRYFVHILDIYPLNIFQKCFNAEAMLHGDHHPGVSLFHHSNSFLAKFDRSSMMLHCVGQEIIYLLKPTEYRVRILSILRLWS